MADKKLLIVDDQPEIIEIIEELVVDEYPCIIKTAANGKIALKLCAEEAFDLICTDFIMPEKTGIEFIKELRASSSLSKNTFIALLTGNEEEAREALGDVSDVLVLNKVENINNLLEIFAKHIK